MSIRVMTLIWDTCLYDGGTLIVLLAMADWANDDGTKVHPGLETLAGKARMTVRGTQKCLVNLRKDGVINAVAAARGGRSKVTEYKINLERVNFLHRLHQADPKGCPRCSKGRTLLHEKGEHGDVKGELCAAYIDNHQEPSVDPSFAREEFSQAVWEKLWQAFQTWPGLSAGASESRARAVCERLWHELPEDLLARVEAHAVALNRQNRLRGRAGHTLVAHPHNWLERDRGWEAYPTEYIQEIEYDRSWGDVAEKLKAAIGDNNFDTYFAGGRFESGPPPRISFPKRILCQLAKEKFPRQLEKCFGEGVILEVAA